MVMNPRCNSGQSDVMDTRRVREIADDNLAGVGIYDHDMRRVRQVQAARASLFMVS
jgi:hypothetical protein